MSAFYLTGNAVADTLLAADRNAVLLGMVLDQQVTMEKAFTGPAVIAERMGGQLDVAAIAAADPEEFAALCAKPPAVHRFPGSMAGRVQGVCQVLVRDWDGQASRMYASATTGDGLKKLIASLPGFGEQKASIFVALLGKRFGVTPPGWEKAAGPYGAQGTYVSVADIVDPESLQRVREAKRLAKAMAREQVAKT
jgi:uncharacterized HhH-GPD family protein